MKKSEIKESFLEYFKYILSKVSFDQNIFITEYRKSFKYLNKKEMSQLDEWLKRKGLLTVKA